jgi:hypothetical protein
MVASGHPQVLVSADGTQRAVLECTKCEAHLSASNPTVSCGANSKEVQQLRADEEVLLSLLEEPEVEGPVTTAVAEQAIVLSDEEDDPYAY